MMGGGHEIGNVTPSAEFNVWADPEAARVVFASGLKNVTVVPLDATHRALVSLEDCKRLRALNTNAATAAALFTEKRIEGYEKVFNENVGSAPVHDALAVLAIVDPSVLESVVEVFVDVETVGELTVGRTVLVVATEDGLGLVSWPLEGEVSSRDLGVSSTARAVAVCCGPDLVLAALPGGDLVAADGSSEPVALATGPEADALACCWSVMGAERHLEIAERRGSELVHRRWPVSR